MRLFVGVSTDQVAAAALRETARRLQKAAPLRHVDPSLYHITLAFLGDQDAGRIPTIRAAMERAAAGVAPFHVALGAVGAFGPILWRGIADGAALNRLSSRVRAALDAAGIWYDKKPFAAHITLARDLRLPADIMAMTFPDAAFPVRSILLFESLRRDGRLAYRPLVDTPLL